MVAFRDGRTVKVPMPYNISALRREGTGAARTTTFPK
jgi:hypothetical protein